MNYKKLLVFGFVILSYVGFSQNDVSIGFSGGYDYNYGHMLNPRNGINSNAIPDFNVGADISWYLGERIRIRAELRYTNFSFTRDLQIPQNGNDKNMKNTILTVNNLDFAPHFDFRLFSLKKLDCYITAGLKAEFNIGDYARSYTYGGEKSNYDSYITDRYNGQTGHINTLAGAVGGLILKYNVNEQLGITLKPEYTSFFNYFYDQNDMPLQRGSLNVGLEWRF